MMGRVVGALVLLGAVVTNSFVTPPATTQRQWSSLASSPTDPKTRMDGAKLPFSTNPSSSPKSAPPKLVKPAPAPKAVAPKVVAKAVAKPAKAASGDSGVGGL